MDRGVEPGEKVEIAYESTRSGNVVSRTGTVVQAPEENGQTTLFVETDDDQLTGATSEYVFSISSSDRNAGPDDESRLQQTVSLGLSCP